MRSWVAPALQLLLTLLLSFAGYWYLLFVVSLALALVESGRSKGWVVGIASLLGVLIAIAVSPSGIEQSFIFAGILGVPRIMPLLLTLLIAFLLGLLGYSLGGDVSR